MIEAGEPSTGELKHANRGVPAPPGVVMVAPPEVPRNAKGRAKGSRRETHGQGQYKGRGFRAPAFTMPLAALCTPVWRGLRFTPS